MFFYFKIVPVKNAHISNTFGRILQIKIEFLQMSYVPNPSQNTERIEYVESDSDV